MTEKMIDKQAYSCYDMLAAAVVNTAIEDWRELIEKGIEKEVKKRAGAVIGFNEIRRFFNSPHCELLMTGMSLKPAAILRQLEKEREEAGL